MSRNIKNGYICMALFVAFTYASFYIALGIAFKWWTIPTVFCLGVTAATFLRCVGACIEAVKEENQ